MCSLGWLAGVSTKGAMLSPRDSKGPAPNQPLGNRHTIQMHCSMQLAQ